MEQIKNYVNGRWVDSKSGETFRSINPANRDEVIGIVPKSDRGDVDQAVRAAREAYEDWRLTPAPRRGEILFRAAEILLRNKESLGKLETREMGKILSEGLGDVQEAIDMGYYMAGEGRRLSGETIPSELPNKDMKSIRVPVGVFGLITPWNFPIAIPGWKVFPALVCGNTVVFKPSSDTPVCATRLVEALAEAGLPKGVLNLIHGPGGEVGEYLVSHPGVDAVSFTGSFDTVSVSKEFVEPFIESLSPRWAERMRSLSWMMRTWIWPSKGPSGVVLERPGNDVLPPVGSLCIKKFTGSLLSDSEKPPPASNWVMVFKGRRMWVR